jgi:drug/metabolite transporter (DMT)-like permease
MGSLWMIVAGLAFAAMGVFAKLGAEHFGSVELVFYRSIVGVLTLGLLARARRWPVATPHWRLHIGRGLSGVISLALYFHCIGRLPLATAVTLNYTSPLFLALLTTVLLHERLRGPLAGALVLAFAGVVLLLEPALREDQMFDGLLGLASGALAAVAYLNVKQLGATGEPSWRVVFYFTLLSTTLAGLWMLAAGTRPVTSDNVWILFGLGATATVGQFTMTKAYHSGHALVVGALSYSTVVFSAVLALALWHEAPPAVGWVGIALIVAGGVLSLRASRAESGNVR